MCVSVKSHLPSGASVHPKSSHVLSRQRRSKNCGVFSETAQLPNRTKECSYNAHHEAKTYMEKGVRRAGLHENKTISGGARQAI